MPGDKQRFLTGFQLGSISAILVFMLAVWAGWLPA